MDISKKYLSVLYIKKKSVRYCSKIRKLKKYIDELSGGTIMKELVIKKVDKAMEGNKDPHLVAIAEYVKTVIVEDSNLAERVLLEIKTLENCSKYVFENARKLAVNNRAMVHHTTVYSWIDEYFASDDLEVDKPKKAYTGKSKTTTKKKEKLPLEMFGEDEVVEEDVEITGAPSDEEIAQMNQEAEEDSESEHDECGDEDECDETETSGEIIQPNITQIQQTSIPTPMEVEVTKQVKQVKVNETPTKAPAITGLSQLSFL